MTVITQNLERNKSVAFSGQCKSVVVSLFSLGVLSSVRAQNWMNDFGVCLGWCGGWNGDVNSVKLDFVWGIKNPLTHDTWRSTTPGSLSAMQGFPCKWPIHLDLCVLLQWADMKLSANHWQRFQVIFSHWGFPPNFISVEKKLSEAVQYDVSVNHLSFALRLNVTLGKKRDLLVLRFVSMLCYPLYLNLCHDNYSQDEAHRVVLSV